MKTHISTLFFLCLINFAFAQDVILTSSGDTIEGKVLEITSSSIKYYRKDQPDGPIRNIELTEVRLITYSDGTKERFVQVEAESEAPSKEPEIRVDERGRQIVKRRGPDRIPADKDRLFGSGMFVDLLVGYCHHNFNGYSSYNYGGLQARLGNKWYFGKGEKYRPGIQATWIRIGGYLSSIYPDDLEKGFIAPLGLGFANVIKFGEKSGMEVNLNIGATLLEPPFSDMDNPFGLLGGLEIKYRYKSLAVGVDLTYIEERLGYGSETLNMASISVGFKF